ncbi:hypothetical protein DERP_001290 [Dermatophagoides pteronyssinus]|uniref:Transmembrane protein n=1 Tax=Dermatophagoides pteronyssinus TaxID=6956 RepID=A0ABQ8JE18_DERPT|nr:hypothetical protein DERP_001290 [Dermatophagoides pteronyssinus]
MTSTATRRSPSNSVILGSFLHFFNAQANIDVGDLDEKNSLNIEYMTKPKIPIPNTTTVIFMPSLVVCFILSVILTSLDNSFRRFELIVAIRDFESFVDDEK